MGVSFQETVLPASEIARGWCIGSQLKGSRRLICAQRCWARKRSSKAEVRRKIRRQQQLYSTPSYEHLTDNVRKAAAFAALPGVEEMLEQGLPDVAQFNNMGWMLKPPG
jgi:hypothetical protein